MTTRTESLDERAARVEAEAAEIRREQERLAAEERQRLAEHQHAYDQAVVSGYSRAELDAAVADAKAALDRAIEADPITQALAAYLNAQYTRTDAHAALIESLGQLGRPTAGSQGPPTPNSADPGDLMTRAAQRLAADALDAAREDRHTRRSAVAEAQ